MIIYSEIKTVRADLEGEREEFDVGHHLDFEEHGSWELSRWKMAIGLWVIRILYLRREGFGGRWHAVVLKTTRVDEFTQGDCVGAKRRGSRIEPCVVIPLKEPLELMKGSEKEWPEGDQENRESRKV